MAVSDLLVKRRDMSPLGLERWQRASPHLDQILDLSPTECDGYLVSLWAADPQVAADVEALLAEHRELSDEGFLDSAPLHRPQPKLAGVTISAYKLVSLIGHGGMGSVWLAERNDGRFEGNAALKLLNAALVGRAVEERFKREGTILAPAATSPHRPSHRCGRVEHRAALSRARAH
jgi:eukaryotic-like serine/threonine-protein kinase